MAVVSRVKSDLFKSSVQLMYITKQLSNPVGVQFRAVMMGTENNKTMLREVGLLTPGVEQASSGDLFAAVAVRHVVLAGNRQRR
jgi:FdrA protein